MSMRFTWASDVNTKEADDAARLERFRNLLQRYRSVWRFDPPKAQFIRLWQQSATEEATEAEAARLSGNA